MGVTLSETLKKINGYRGLYTALPHANDGMLKRDNG